MIRNAQLEDCRAIAELHVASWRHTYVGQVPDEYLAALCAQKREQGWRESFGFEGHRVILAEHEGLLQGFVSFGPSRDKDTDAGKVGEVYAIYLHPDCKGRGLGTGLWDAAVHGLAALGFSEATAWVLDTNASARRFYERRGCSLDGGTKADSIGGRDVVELRYRCELA